MNTTFLVVYELIKNLSWFCTVDFLPELSSDHNPIKLNFSNTSKFELSPPQLNTNWSIFTKNVGNYDNFDLPTANSTHEIDSQVRNLLNESLDAHKKREGSKLINHSE
ncbi:hypothetical protein TNIN_168661 [Trichonephila inaurata madagascariensis]|uniref:Uncharacterized protein n=1 Tax=Trichonephila inaurata madagascariensis TaxID=2747483 RepID=A0A8X6JRN5_9ARAC|nr:hypothetical protein TNIN_168661 [Trichonephila inaurata madagascariensis]